MKVLIPTPLQSYTNAREVDAAGTIVRIACGRTIRKNCRRRGMPKAAAASRCPAATPTKPERTISAEYAAWCNDRPRVAATMGGIASRYQ